VTSLARELGTAPTAADVEAAVLRAFGVDTTDPSVLLPAEVVATERLLADRYAVPAWHADDGIRTG
jgi:hypothetical protein